MDFSLRLRAHSHDYDIVGEDNVTYGQVIHSVNGFTIYLLGDFERLFPPHESADDALEAFEDWAASNTLTNILTIDTKTSN